MFTLNRRSSQASIASTTPTIESTAMTSGVAAKHPDLPALVTRRNVNETVASYNVLLAAAKKYRNALLQVSEAAADFGQALEDSARCKGADSSSEGLTRAGGLHYLVSNHQQILANTIQHSFEQPVRKQIQQLCSTAAKNEQAFRVALTNKTQALRAHEADNIRLLKKRVRNLAAYRSSILELTSQLDDIDRLKYEHFVQQYDLAQITSSNVLSCAAAVVRAEVEIYEGIARKGWSGGGLDDLISTGLDPFAPSEDEDDEQEVDLYPSPKRGFHSFVFPFGDNQHKHEKTEQAKQKPLSETKPVAFRSEDDKENQALKDSKPPLDRNDTIQGFFPSKPDSNHDHTNSLPLSRSPSNLLTNDLGLNIKFTGTNNTGTNNNSSGPNISLSSSPWNGSDSVDIYGNNTTNVHTGFENDSDQLEYYRNDSNSSIAQSTNNSPYQAALEGSNLNQYKFNDKDGKKINDDNENVDNNRNDRQSSYKPVLISSPAIKSSHIKQANGKGLFSILPSTSILPRPQVSKSDSSKDKDVNPHGVERKVSLSSIGKDSIDYQEDNNEEPKDKTMKVTNHLQQ